MGLLVDPPTGTILSISFFVKLSSSRTSGTGSRVSLNNSVFNFSDLALVRVSKKSSPANEDSTSPVPTDLVGGLLSKENLGSLLRLGQDHDVDFLRAEGLDSVASVPLHVGLGRLFDSCEGTEFGIKHCVLGVGGELVLG